ncbi:hypothetical protein [uncultured Nostoc sp.]|uniref:hypothetical protein n=1 Tax=uncultured Nostoc sp. TaxID=340711 RepID=UPI0035CB1B32
MQQERSELLFQVKELKQECSHIQQVQQENSHLKSHLSNSEAQLHQVQHEYSNLESYLSNSEAQLHQVQHERSQLQAQLEELQRKCSQLESEKELLERSQSYISELQSNLEQAKQEIKRLQLQMSQIQSQQQQTERERLYMQQPMSFEIQQHLQDTLKQLSVIEEKLDKALNEQENIKLQIKNIISEQSNLRSELQNSKDDINKNIEKRFDALEPLNQLTPKMQDYLSDCLGKLLEIDSQIINLRSLIDPDKSTLEGHSVEVTSVAISPDGKNLVSGDSEGIIQVWDWNTKKNKYTINNGNNGHSGMIFSIAINSNQGIIASCSKDKLIKLWSLKKGEYLGDLLEHQASVCAVAITPDGQRLVSGSGDNKIIVWDIADTKKCKIRHTFDGNDGHTKPVVSIAINPDQEDIIVSGSYDNTIKIWDINTGRILGTENGRIGDITSVSISPNGRFIAAGSDKSIIKIWELNLMPYSMTFKESFQEHTERITSLAFTSNKTLYSGSNDGTVRIWDVENKKQIKCINTGFQTISSITISPEEEIIVCSNQQTEIQIIPSY